MMWVFLAAVYVLVGFWYHNYSVRRLAWKKRSTCIDGGYAWYEEPDSGDWSYARSVFGPAAVGWPLAMLVIGCIWASNNLSTTTTKLIPMSKVEKIARAEIKERNG